MAVTLISDLNVMRWYCLNVTGTNLIALTKIQMDLLELLVNFYCFFFKQETHCNYFKGLCIVQISFHRFFSNNTQTLSFENQTSSQTALLRTDENTPSQESAPPTQAASFCPSPNGQKVEQTINLSRKPKPIAFAGGCKQWAKSEYENHKLKMGICEMLQY